MDNENNAAADTEYYLNAYLQDNEFPLLEELEAEHVAGERLQNLLENVGHWLASTPLKTRQNDKLWLGRKSKADHFQRMKDSLEEKFPDHALFDPYHALFDGDGDGDGDGNDWFSDMKRSFKNECDRHPIKNIVTSTLGQTAEPATDKPVAASEDGQAYKTLQSQQSQLHSLSQHVELLNQQTLDLGMKLQEFSVVFGDKLDAALAVMENIDKNSNNNDGGPHSNNEEAIVEMYRENTKTKTARIDQLRQENDRLKRMLNTMLSPSPSVPRESSDLNDDNDDGSTASTADWDGEPATKKARTSLASGKTGEGDSSTGEGTAQAITPPDIAAEGGTKKRKNSMTMGFHYRGVFIPSDTAWSPPKKFAIVQLINMWLLGDMKNRMPPLRFFADRKIRFCSIGVQAFSKMKALMTHIEIFGREENVWLTGTSEDWNAAAVAKLWKGIQHKLSPYLIADSMRAHKGATYKKSLEGETSWRTCYNRMSAGGLMRGNRRGPNHNIT